jgi:RHH-type rel operon transcriptional repressor/antitoxin RelB
VQHQTEICYTCITLSAQEKTMLAIRLPEELESRLDALAQATGRSKSFYVREALLEHMDDLEDLYLAEQRLIDLRAGRTQTVPLEDVMKRYGLED